MSQSIDRNHDAGRLPAVSSHHATEESNVSNPANVFTDTGWHLHGDQHVYLHAGGAIGRSGPAAGIRMRLGQGLDRFALPHPPGGDELRKALRASLDLLDAAPEMVATALLAMVYRAPLGAADFSGFLLGPTGSGKSELAALAQQHFGATMDSRHLPATWSSTANTLWRLADQAKDALLVISDCPPPGSAHHDEPERLLRAQGNRSARCRMGLDMKLLPPEGPRGLLLTTGRKLPLGIARLARLLVVDVAHGDVCWTQVSELQEQAARGTLAAAMAGYLRWLAAGHRQEATSWQPRFEELREMAGSAHVHRRTPSMIANLAVGYEHLLQFARDVDAIDAREQQELWGRGWRALLALGAAQAVHLAGLGKSGAAR